MQDDATPLPPADQRAARLDARLALYAQYAGLVSDEMAAAWSTDPDRAGRHTREIARMRGELAEHYAELKAVDEAPAGREAFGGVLAEMVTELEHQAALDRALRSQVETLRRLALPAAAQSPVDVGPDAGSVEPVGASSEQATAVQPLAEQPLAEQPHAEHRHAADAVDAAFGGALVAARTGGVGGMLGGQYPGVATGAFQAGALGTAPESDGARLDVRF